LGPLGRGIEPSGFRKGNTRGSLGRMILQKEKFVPQVGGGIRLGGVGNGRALKNFSRKGGTRPSYLEKKSNKKQPGGKIRWCRTSRG